MMEDKRKEHGVIKEQKVKGLLKNLSKRPKMSKLRENTGVLI